MKEMEGRGSGVGLGDEERVVKILKKRGSPERFDFYLQRNKILRQSRPLKLDETRAG